MLLSTAYLSVSEELAGAVHIPLAELPKRTLELPPPHKLVRVVRNSVEAYYALGWLHARGWRAVLAEPPVDVQPNARYRLWEPNEWLEIVVPHLTVGHALDLGCGTGRDAVFLADCGWQVVAVDRLPEALERGRMLQHRYAPDSPPVEWVCADLEKSDWSPSGKFDLITLFFFFSWAVLERALHWLAPDGSLLIEAFTAEHRARYGKPASEARTASADTLRQTVENTLKVLHCSEGWRASGRHTVRLWARR
ncbi:MAG: class I SAM-dependent methyltransferase [Armatimonadota bacterium]|nr:class I SAM-dependent methyltransferase [Armatimonadota bacterium]